MLVVELSGRRSLAIRDLPSFLTESTDPIDYFHVIFLTFHDLFDALDMETSTTTVVIVNSCEELEVGALATKGPHDVLPIGLVLPSGDD